MSTSIIERLEAFNLKTIDIDEIDLSKFILSKFGEHNQDEVEKTLRKKTEDIENLSRCYWALGNLNPENTRYFCEEHCETSGKIFVLMPYTKSNSTRDKAQFPYVRYSLWSSYKSPEDLPQGMNPVTGPDNSNRALVIKKLYMVKGTYKKGIYDEMFPYYETFLADKSIGNPHKRIPSVCMQLRNGEDHSAVKQIFKKYESEQGELAFLAGELETPYCVALLRGEKNEENTQKLKEV